MRGLTLDGSGGVCGKIPPSTIANMELDMNKTRLLISLLAAAALSARADLSDGLVTWFSFDSADSSGRVENLADSSRPLSIVSGGELDSGDAVGGSSISFPGEFGQGATFYTPALTNCTVSFWYKRGVTDGYWQESASATEELIPDFDLTGV